jgi:hypothetical protein
LIFLINLINFKSHINATCPIWIVGENSDQLKYVDYYSLFEKLERRKVSVTRTSGHIVRVCTISLVGGEKVILCLYVDDILIFGTSHNMITMLSLT